MLGDRIRKMRKEKGYSQEQLARKLHLTQGAVSQWEHEITAPSADQIVSLANVFGITSDELLGRETSTKIEAPFTSGLRESVMRLYDEIEAAGLTDAEAEYIRSQIEGIKALRKQE